jgi:hypothetical protein
VHPGIAASPVTLGRSRRRRFPSSKVNAMKLKLLARSALTLALVGCGMSLGKSYCRQVFIAC